MIKQLTLFCTFAIFMLAVGGAVTPAQAHCQEEGSGLPHTGDHPHCTDDDLVYPVYDVVIDLSPGTILSGTGMDWVYDGKAVSSLRPRDDILDMSYFNSIGKAFDNPDVSAFDCFDQEGHPDILNPAEYPEVRFGGYLQKHRKSTARGMFWFPGTTSDSNDGAVLYLLIVEGTFDENESGVGFPKNNKIMHMTDWTLKKEGGGEASSRACEGSGTFPFDGFTVTFTS